MAEFTGTTVVIAGASSGIGRAAALAFARRGANVVVAARRSAALVRLAHECRDAGGQGLAIAADVTDAAGMRRLAQEAIRRFGRIDVWINNAGVGAVGRFTETPVEAHDRVIETNLVGALHGAHAVLPHFLRQRRGILINTISFGGWVPAPYAASYSASKFGLRGLSDSLRAELQDHPDIHVCDVFPSFIDTPGVQHGANYTGRRLKPAPPVYAPERVAEAMVRLARRPRDAVTVGSVATLARLGYALAPRLGRWAMARFIGAYLRQARPAPVSSGNLFRPVTRGTGAHGGWRSPSGRSLAEHGPAGRGLAVTATAALGIVGAMLLARAASAADQRGAERRGAGASSASQEFQTHSAPAPVA